MKLIGRYLKTVVCNPTSQLRPIIWFRVLEMFLVFLVAIFLGCGVGGLSAGAARKCDPPAHSMVAIFQNVTDGPFEIGHRLSYKCRPGYSLSSKNPYIECLEAGWTPVSSCRPKRCSTLPDLQFGDISYPDKGPVFGSRVNFSCHAGYVLVGSAFSECLIAADGGEGQRVEWTHPVPHCVNTYCAPPGNIEGGHFFPFKEAYEHREAVIYTCHANVVPLTLVGKKSLVCLEGEWSSAPPECRAITCPLPRILHGFLAIRPRTRYIPGDHIRMMCLDGFQFLDGSSEAESDCTVSGSWEPPIPVCKPLNAPWDDEGATTESASQWPPPFSPSSLGYPDHPHTSTTLFPNRVTTIPTSAAATSYPPVRTPINSILVASLTALAVSALLALGIFFAAGCAWK